MNDLRKGQDSHNQEELKLLSRQQNRDELQRFAILYYIVQTINALKIKERTCNIFLKLYYTLSFL